MNPLMQMMSGQNSAGGNPQLGNILRMLKGGNPEQIARGLMEKNPQFKAFMEQNQGKTPEQVAKEMGLDLSQISQMLK